MRDADDKTNAHLLLADENFDTARRLMLLDPLPARWVAVVAFYSAVHYLGAYFWERYRIEVNSHRHRARLIGSYRETENVWEHYNRLFRRSLDARYETEFDASLDELEYLLDAALVTLRDTLHAQLNE